MCFLPVMIIMRGCCGFIMFFFSVVAPHRQEVRPLAVFRLILRAITASGPVMHHPAGSRSSLLIPHRVRSCRIPALGHRQHPIHCPVLITPFPEKDWRG